MSAAGSRSGPPSRVFGRATLTKYAAVARISLANQLAYSTEVLLRTVFLAMMLYIFVQLWTVVGSELRQFSVAQMIWYLMIAEAIVLTRPRISQEIDAEVRAGDIAYQLLRPYDYVGARLAASLGERALRLAITLAVGTLLALLLVGPIAFHPLSLAVAALLLILGAVLDFLCALAIGLCAFWLEDTQSLTLLYDRAVMLLGGMLLPLELFPDWLVGPLQALPFQLILYAPSRMAVTGDLAPLSGALTGLGLSLVAMLVVVRLVFGVAVRRLHANGG